MAFIKKKTFLDIVCEIEGLLSHSGFDWATAYDPKTGTHYFKLCNRKVEEEPVEKKDE